jgi:hypothetical protein
MIRTTIRGVACVVTLFSAVAPARSLAATAPDPCALLSIADIEKATGLHVGKGESSPPIPGTLGKCTWSAGGTRVLVTLTDARHIEITMNAITKSGGSPVQGLGTSAVGSKAAGATGGGYIVNVQDASGGFGVSILGAEGNRDRAVALAKIVATHR